MKTFNLLVGGTSKNLPDDWQEYRGEWIGVDRGALNLLKADKQGSIALGDFDSVDSKELDQIEVGFKEVVKLNPIKDDTDTESGVQFVLERDPKAHIRVFGISGGRLDHLLANVLMVLQDRFRMYAEQIELIDRQNNITFYNSGKHTIDKIEGYKYLSFIPLTQIDALTLDDEKYQLHNEMVSNARAFVSNEFIGNKATVYLSNGLVAVIQSKD
ncbi:thiamine diphosphokinase [Pediococcus stilesii]|uniref:Thiamine diphosphokinase n=1 Tax=Pediococcus stilesii TaxID=331679 RepID=A0A0R2L0F2_9LACO|nr:thiamine diphosphokinase [Pediococcus stilesii]KRN95257.1 thiamine pyrophosphokinase [Pediococcus stilesii]